MADEETGEYEQFLMLTKNPVTGELMTRRGNCRLKIVILGDDEPYLLEESA